MKVNGTDPHSLLGVYQTAQSRGVKLTSVNTETSGGATAAPQQDRVALSGSGRLIADAQRAIASVPDVREPLVSRIQSELQNGTYVFDNQRAAEGILRESMVNQAAMR